MNNKYKNIDFDAFDIEPDQLLDDNQKDKHIGNFYKSINVDRGAKKHQTISMKKFSRKFIAITAAIIMVLAFGAVAYATDMFGLKNLAVKNDEFGTQISIQGYVGSPEYKGFVEWTEYVENYDPDRIIYEESRDKSISSDLVYGFEYDCYTKEMVDKLEEIAAKYNLSLHGEKTSYDDFDEMMGNLELENLINMKHSSVGGYAYEDGTFQLDFTPPYVEPESNYEPDIYVNAYDSKYQTPEEIIETYGKEEIASNRLYAWAPRDSETGEVFYDKAFVIESVDGELTAVPYEGEYDLKKEREANLAKFNEHDQESLSAAKGFQFRYNVKGSLDYVGFSIKDINDFDEWEYKTKSGVTVNLAQSDDGAFLILDLDKAFVTINLFDYASSSKKEIEELVDKINFSLLQ